MRKKLENIFKKYFKDFKLYSEFEGISHYISETIPNTIVCVGEKKRISIVNNLYYDVVNKRIGTKTLSMRDFEKFSHMDYTGIERYLMQLTKEIKEINLNNKFNKIQEDF